MDILEILRIIAGVVLFFVPGYLMVSLLFSGKEMRLLSRILLGFCLGVAIIVIGLFILCRGFHLPFNSITVLGVISFTTVVLFVLNIARRGKPGIPHWQRITLSRKYLPYLLLCLIMALAYFVSFIPRINYEYPLHSDEWFHYNYAQELYEEKSIPFTEPFYGEEQIDDHAEIGFHIFLAVIKTVTGASWLAMFRYLPGVVMISIVLAAFLIGRPKKYGLEAAFFATFLPTTVENLGTAFLVPMGLGLLMFAASLYLLHNHGIKMSTSVIIIVLTVFLCICHPITVVAVYIVYAIYAFLSLRGEEGEKTKSKAPLGQFLLCVLLTAPVYLLRFPLHVINLTSNILSPRLYLPLYISDLQKLGTVTLVLFILGLAYLAYRSRWRYWGLMATVLAFWAIVLIYNLFEIGIPPLYERSFFYIMFLITIIAGMFAMVLRNWLKLIVIKTEFRYGRLLTILVMATIFTFSGITDFRAHFNEPYYHITNDKQYNDAVWIRQNLDYTYAKVITDPMSTIAFSVLSGKYIYASNDVWLYSGEEILEEAYNFLDGKAADTTWMIDNSISIVYTKKTVANHDLVKVAERTYILPHQSIPQIFQDD
ncbi:hypothetical protein ACFLXZ_02205 [Chloroflexota bacterium]